MLKGKAVVGASLALLLLGGCAPSGKEARTLADKVADNRPVPVAPSQQAAPAAIQVPSTAAGVRVFMDPATGQTRAPTAQEWAGMVQKQEQKKRQAVNAAPPTPAREITLSDGTRGYVLGDAANTSLRLCKQADGATSVGHDCPQPARDATHGKAP